MEEIKNFLVYELKHISYSNKAEYYDENDFDLMFQAFDVFSKEEISQQKMGIIFKILRIPYDQQAVQSRHKLSGE